MRGLFNAEGPVMNALMKLFDCIMLSLCWIAASLPIVTMGTACGALYRTVYRCIRRDEGYPLKMFWDTWKQNLKTGIITWLPVLGVYAFLIVDALILRGLASEGSPLARYLGIIVVLIAVCSVWAAYCTAYCVRFEGKLGETLWLCLFLTLSHPLMSLALLLFLVLAAVLALLVPYMLIFLPAAVCLLMSYPMETVFLKHMRPEDIEKLSK